MGVARHGGSNAHAVVTHPKLLVAGVLGFSEMLPIRRVARLTG